MTIVGYRKYDFTNEHGHYSGYKVYCTNHGYGNIIGDTVDSFSVSDRVCEASNFVPSVGLEIEVSYRKESRNPARIFIL